MNYRITLAYDGTDYAGWQMQLGQPTLQAAVEKALETIEGAPVTTYAAGRTDAGVHAEGQVISCRLSRSREGWAVRRALNGNLPETIRVLEASPVPDDFHARRCATAKTYRYQLYLGDIMPPFLTRYAWLFPYRLDLERLAEDSRGLLGEHDFSAFTVSSCQTRTRVRTVTEIRMERDGQTLKLFFTGNGFLRYQVRTMVGALVDVNRGRLKGGSIEALLEGGNRSMAGVSAPARGLTLMKVEY
jgi:tRNA pseudouridine38-40 synthase